MVKVIIIVAMTRVGHVIGQRGKLPWNIPEEMRHFRKTTLGYPVIMGRVTYQSIVGYLGHGLKGRTNIVVSTTLQEAKGATVVSSLDEALRCVTNDEQAFIIGGAQLYAAGLQVADELLISFIDQQYSGDTVFPSFDQWIKVEEHTFEGFSVCRFRR